MEKVERSTRQRVRFGMFEADLRTRELFKAGRKIKLPGQPFQVLALLLDRSGELVTREELRQHLWSADTFVDFDHSLNKAINKIREVLGDSAENPRFVETLARRGYRFIAPVEKTERKLLGESRPPGADGPDTLAATLASPSKAQQVPKETPQAKSRRFNRWIVWAGLSALVAGTAGWFYLHRSVSRPELPPLKVVRFTSYPGKEKDPALSPDGRQLAFVWDGEQGDNFDVYVQLIGGGKPLRLTSDPNPDVSPAWSPDGSQIAFARLAEGTSNIYLIPSLGGHEHRLAELYSVWSEGKALDWSRDGKLLAAAGKSSPAEPYGLFLISVETGTKQKLTSSPVQIGGDVYPSFSPDGQTVAFTRVADSSGYLVPVSGGEARRLASNSTSWGSAWTPNGREIIFFSDHLGTSKFWRVPSSGGKAEGLEIGTNGTHQAISHQGTRLAYVEQTYDTDIWRLEVPDSEGRGSRPTKLIYSSQPDDNPQYSPDGRRVVFGSKRSGNYVSWVCDSDGRNPFPLVSSNEITRMGSPRWSPDGRNIAFDGGLSVFVVSADGGSPRRLTGKVTDGILPTWSKDGRWIYFTSNRSGEFQIWKMPAEGGEATGVTKNGGSEALESPDGSFLYYSKMDKNEAMAGSAHIWKVSLPRGDETLAFKEAIYPRYWAMTDRGIYFVPSDWSRRPVIELFSFATRQVTQVVPLEKAPARYAHPGLSISPDGRWILCALVEQDTSDIMLVENFR